MAEPAAPAPDWRVEPKVELHLHLEGACPPALARARAAATGADLSDLIAEDGYRWEGFSGFLSAYDRVAALFRAPDAARALAEAVLRECAAHGVIYAELILSPDHAGGDAASWADHLAAVTEGAAAAEATTGIVARFIATGVRHFGVARVENAARLAVAAAHPRIVGFNIAGDERVGRFSDYAPAFAIAREAGLGLTAHAGEFGGADSVRAALDALRPARIGHGVRAIEDPALVRRLAAEGVVLEVCPGSNVALGVFDWAEHPFRALRDAGVRVTLSTDDPPFFRTTMTREYAMAADRFGLDAAALRAIARDSLDAAFCDAETKARLAPKLA
jgi:adenosine deaminase